MELEVSNTFSATTNTAKPENKDENKKICCRFSKTALLVVVLLMTISYFVVEITVGFMTKSNALIADSFHMLSDVISLIIGIVAVRFSKRETSKNNTFGWVRAEILGALVNSVFLLALCFSIVIDAISRFVEPEPLEKIDLMLAIGGGGLAMNLISMMLFGIQDCLQSTSKNKIHAHNHNHVHGSHTHSHHNMNIYGVFLHVAGDSLGSIAVVMSSCLIKFVPPKDNTREGQWKLYIDPILSLVITGLIAASTISLIKRSSLILLQSVPKDCNADELKKLILSIDNVVNVHRFHIWSLNSEKLVASTHVRISGQKNEDKDLKVLDNLKRLFHSNNIHYTTIQLEYDENSNDSCNEDCDVNKDMCISKRTKPKNLYHF